MAGQTLHVFHAEKRIGRLGYDPNEQVYSFEYAEAWQDDPTAFDLAPLLPRKDRLHSGSAVRFFFSNLLPEGEMLEIVARTHGVSKYDPFGLLRKIGAECAGALSILESDTARADGKTYARIRNEELSARARADAADLLANAGGRLRMSLAGVQDKLPALVTSDGTVALPEPGSASAHILKPDNRQWRAYPHSAANEHFCMELARRLGLDVPRSALMKVPESIYVVERFDRVFEHPLEVAGKEGLLELQGAPVRRLHQIDVCQLLGIPPTQKYEEPEFETPPGPNLPTIVEALSGAVGDALAVRQALIEWVIFNYLVGNSDSHSKNISMLWKDGRWRLAPTYDLLSVAVYSEDPEKLHDLAFTIGGETRYAWITGARWLEFSNDLGVGYRYVQRALLRLSSRVRSQAEALVKDLSSRLSIEERGLIEKILALIQVHAGYAEESARTMPEAARLAREGARKAQS